MNRLAFRVANLRQHQVGPWASRAGGAVAAAALQQHGTASWGSKAACMHACLPTTC